MTDPIARAVEALERIVDGRGLCRFCRTWAVGAGPGYIECGCAQPQWEAADPQWIARTALAALREAQAGDAPLRAIATFGAMVSEGWPELGTLDDSDVFDMMDEAGMIVSIPGGFDPAQHEDTVGIDPEPGDPWFEWASGVFPVVRSLLKANRKDEG